MDLFQSPGFLINRLAHLMSNELEKKFKVHGVTPSQWAILAVLWQKEGIPQVDIQQRLKLEGATVTGLLQRMGHAGLIIRKPHDEDKRVLLVFLTDHGRQLKEVLIPEAKQVNEEALQGFSEDEQKFFVSLLCRALQNFHFT